MAKNHLSPLPQAGFVFLFVQNVGGMKTTAPSQSAAAVRGECRRRVVCDRIGVGVRQCKKEGHRCF